MTNPSSSILALLQTLHANHHRGVVVLHGDAGVARQWCTAFTRASTPRHLLISEQDIGGATPPAVFQTHLGREYDLLVWDGFSGFHPNALAALSGTLCAGGLLVLLMPDATALSDFRDADQQRMMRPSDASDRFHHHYLQRLLQQLTLFTHTCTFAADEWPSAHHLIQIHQPCSVPLTQAAVDDQHTVVAAICRLMTQVPPAPLVLTAGRGRGKSAAMGLAIARLQQTHAHSLNLVVTAPKSLSASEVMHHCQRSGGRAPLFMAPDALLREHPAADMVFIDEAAALAAPLLAEIVARYPRCVLATTTHGYEGSGRGFELRLGAQLSAQFPTLSRWQLHHPIRWGDDDPLEAFINAVFCLQGALPSTLPPSAPTPVLERVSAAQLAADDALLEATMALLVSAHYQTTPDDLRMILDHPAVMCWLARIDDRVVAACVVIAEGDIEDAPLIDGVITGQRRPRGHLVPQLLTQHSGSGAWMQAKSWRIMRIAVHPERRRQGLGRLLIESVNMAAEQERIAFLSTSFGLSDALLSFWTAANFVPVRLGYHQDAASNSYSIVMLRDKAGESTDLQPLVAMQQQSLADQLHWATERLFPLLPTPLCRRLAALLPAPETGPTHAHFVSCQRVALSAASLADAMAALTLVLRSTAGRKALASLTPEQAALLHDRFIAMQHDAEVVARHGLKGKRALQTRTREALARWYEAMAHHAGETLRDAN